MNKVYSVYDIKSETYGDPVIFDNDVAAARAFEGAVNDGKSLFSQFPNDFKLVYVGQWSREDGTIGFDGDGDVRHGVCVAGELVHVKPNVDHE